MTTLPANMERLPEHCSHKLPTSCRLTALPICCACQDRRPHSSSYAKYIDGVGFVQWGTRQERYCWMCKEFWNARIAAANVPQSSTHIPEVPDQTGFLEKWYDWHRGYKDITLEDGTSERQHLEGERLEDTAPGCLPRTTEEIRSGQVSEPSAGILSPPSLRNDPNAQNIYIPTTQHHDDDIDPEDSIFDGLPAPPLPVNPSGPLAAASTARPNNIRRSAHRLASLRRELQHMRLGIDRIMSNIQGTETSLPDSEEAVNTTIRLENRLNTLQAQLTQTNHSRQLVQDVAVNRAQENGDGDHTQAHRERLMASERYRDDFRHLRDHAQDLVRDLEVQHEQACRTAYQHRLDLNDYRRSLTVFGTPAEAQQPDYESPVGGMFNRATEGYQIAEAQRVQHNQPQEARSRSVIAQLLETDRAMQANGIVPHPSQQAEPSTNEATQGHEINQVQGGHPIVGTVLSASERLTDFTSGGRALNDLDAQAAANVGLEALAAWRVGGSTNNVDTTPVAPATSSTPPNFAPVANMGQNMGPRPLVVHPAGYALRDLIRTAALDFPRAFDFPESDVLLAEARNSLQSPANQIPNHQLTAPAPIDEEAKKVSMECKICFEQLSTVAVLPCGHCVMCKWCANRAVPSHPQDINRPLGIAHCPICRHRVNRKVDIYV